ILTSNLLSKQYVNEGLNTSSAVTNLNSILGAKVRKDIRAGDVIKQSDLCLIAKGDIVTIEAVSANMQIKTQGVALEEGKLNDLISVRNSKSKKVIQGIVVSPNTVRVTF
ncbi:MAG: flagellar basal body P-ring formation chaperone FlgA, partial [Succinivibrio sp.]|nr:flagellar basal body P-ring formation chaperone FlgA [Succinivibrio sp.]